MKAIPTRYKGIEFRSKLEAQWAATLDTLNVPWIYEPEGYEFSDGTRYLPDFYLPDSKQFFEVKGIMKDADMHKIEALCRESDKDVVIGYPDGHVQMLQTDESGFGISEWPSKPDDTILGSCFHCNKRWFLTWSGNYRCGCCGYYSGDWFGSIDNLCNEDEQKKIEAYQKGYMRYIQTAFNHSFIKIIPRSAV